MNTNHHNAYVTSLKTYKAEVEKDREQAIEAEKQAKAERDKANQENRVRLILDGIFKRHEEHKAEVHKLGKPVNQPLTFWIMECSDGEYAGAINESPSINLLRGAAAEVFNIVNDAGLDPSLKSLLDEEPGDPMRVHIMVTI